MTYCPDCETLRDKRGLCDCVIELRFAVIRAHKLISRLYAHSSGKRLEEPLTEDALREIEVFLAE